MRKLVTIRQVKEILPIEGADLIELAKIDGWQCVIKKGEFKAGDYGVYFEIDSFLPIDPRYEFLRKSCYKKMPDGKEGFRIKTIKIKKILSQGLLMPISLFDTELKPLTNILHIANTDITPYLRVEKYEPPIPAKLTGEIKGTFPYNIRKTDQERIQNLWDNYKIRYNDTPFEVSLKLDGTSMTVYYDEGNFGVCSRNLELKDSEKNTFWKVTKDLNLEKILKEYGKSIALQGELIGNGINGNNEKLNDNKFFVFDIWDIEDQRHFPPVMRDHILTSLNDIGVKYSDNKIVSCPVLYMRQLREFNSLEEILALADGESMNKDSLREGLVFRSLIYRNGEIISFKIISNKYLLQEK